MDGVDRLEPHITVLVVEDHQLLAESLAVALDLQPGLRCIGTAGTVGDALAAIARSHPDVVLMDLGLPGVDGIEGIRLVRTLYPRCRVLACTGMPTARALVDAAEAGATGFAPKHMALGRLTEAVRGRRAASASAPVVHEMLGTAGRPASAPTGTDEADGGDGGRVRLTARERDVLHELAWGLDVEQIARHLGITPGVCRGHMRRVCGKLGVHTQLAALVRAVEAGMLPVPPVGPVGPAGSAGPAGPLRLEPLGGPERPGGRSPSL